MNNCCHLSASSYLNVVTFSILLKNIYSVVSFNYNVVRILVFPLQTVIPRLGIYVLVTSELIFILILKNHKDSMLTNNFLNILPL